MAKPQIPSIVVQNGSASPPGSPSNKDLPPRPSLSKQTSLNDEDEEGESASGGNSGSGALLLTNQHHQDYHRSGKDFSPAISSPVSPPSPAGGSTPSVGNSPRHTVRRRSLTPSSSSSHNSSGRGPDESSVSGSAAQQSPLPQGPGPGGGGAVTTTMAVGRSESSSEGVELSSCPASMSSRSKSLDLPRQQRPPTDDKDPHRGGQRNLHSSKLKLLVRSHAMQEDTSPPPPDIMTMMDTGGGSMMMPYCGQGQQPMPSLGGGGGGPPRRRLRHQGSSQGSYDGSSPCLSRDSSMEYTDSTGVDLLPFIIQTLHKNQKDRMLLLKIERELINMVRDPKRTYHKFPHMSSYQRMLVHRVAAFFGMEHNVDQIGTCVIVNKTRNTRLPETRFRDHIRDELLLLPPDEPKRSILRRGFSSFEEESSSYKSPDRMLQGLDSRRSKSFEEREQEYEKVRRRIFSQESFSLEGMGDSPRRFHDHFLHIPKRGIHEDSRWHLPVDLETHKKHFDNHRIRPSRLPKGESFESHDSLNPRSLRPPVFKSHSFGGYSGGVTVLSRGNSVASNPASGLTKQDSTGSRYSDHSSSSGYKTQRQDTSSTNVSNTLSTTPSPTAGQFYHPSFGQGSFWGAEGEAHPVMWAVTDMEAVPTGALLINPHSGQPYTNPDGSVYRYDPSNPPPFLKTPPSLQHKMYTKEKEDSSKLFGEPERSVTSPPSSTATNTSVALPSLSPEHSSGSGADIPQRSHECPSTPSKETQHRLPTSEKLQDSNYGSEDHEEQQQAPQQPSCRGPPPEASDSLGGKQNHPKGSSSGAEEDSQQHKFFHPPPHLEKRSYVTQEGVTEVANQLRHLNLSASTNVSEGPPEVSPSSVGTPLPHQAAYVIPRHQYPSTVYYMPAAAAANLPGGASCVKYVYPPATVSGGAATFSPHHHPPQIAAALNTTSNLPTLHQQQQQPLAGPAAGPGPPPPGGGGQNPPPGVEATSHHLPHGFVPNNYAVVAYPSNGVLGPGSTGGGSGGAPHESGGTTYYCQIAGPAAIAPAAPAPNPPGPIVSLSCNPVSSTTTAFPVALSYYTGSGVSNSGLYPTPGVQGFPPGAMYGGPPSHSGVGPHHPPLQGTITYRAPTPPHTPSTQGVNVPLGFNSAGGPGPPPSGGGQLIAVVPQAAAPPAPPPPQPPTPTTQASHLFPTFFRPPVQMMSGSPGTPPPPHPPPPPPPQYGVVSGGALPAPHPPVFAKPYMGSSSAHHHPPPPLIPAAVGACGGGPGNKEENKRYVGGGALPSHQSGSGVPAAPPPSLPPPPPPPPPPPQAQPPAHHHHHHHFIPRPFTLMQSDLARAGSGSFRAAAPILISGHRPRHILTSGGGFNAALNFGRPPPKFRKPKSRNMSYSRSPENLSSTFASQRSNPPPPRDDKL